VIRTSVAAITGTGQHHKTCLKTPKVFKFNGTVYTIESWVKLDNPEYSLVTI
jgi:hypothetical protein